MHSISKCQFMSSGVALVSSLWLVLSQSAWAEPAVTNSPGQPWPAWASKIALHNCGGAEVTADGQGIELNRLPASVRQGLSEKGVEQSRHPTLSEIRFVLNPGEHTDRVSLTIEPTSPEGVFVTCYVGDSRNQSSGRLLTKKETFGFKAYGYYTGGYAGPTPRGKNRIGPVCRVVLSGGPARLLGITGNIRPPGPDALPPVMLSYGTSISHGAMASRAELGFTAITARMIGYDLVNLGLSGTAYCEPVMADYIAAQPWDMCLLELSVNMLDDYTVEQFAERARNVVNKTAASHPKAPVVCISILPWLIDGWDKNHPSYLKEAAFRQALKDICAKSGRPNVYFMDGPDLAAGAYDLCQDVLHPSDYGMIQVAWNLVPRLREIVNSNPHDQPPGTRRMSHE